MKCDCLIVDSINDRFDERSLRLRIDYRIVLAVMEAFDTRIDRPLIDDHLFGETEPEGPHGEGIKGTPYGK